MPPETTANPAIARLATLVDESGLTRSDVAGRAGMKPGDLSRLLSGRRDPALSTVGRVLRAVGGRWADLDEDQG